MLLLLIFDIVVMLMTSRVMVFFEFLSKNRIKVKLASTVSELADN